MGFVFLHTLQNVFNICLDRLDSGSFSSTCWPLDLEAAHFTSNLRMPLSCLLNCKNWKTCKHFTVKHYADLMSSNDRNVV